MKKLLIGLILLQGLFLWGQVQEQEQFDANTLVQIPNSPEAEAFTKYGNVPVSYYTGKPNVSVPVYTIEGREFSVPISLTYDASGIKVQSISTSAGAGWNLNAGGMVTRQIYDLPDDLISGHPDLSITDSKVRQMNTYLNSLRHPERGYYLNFESYEHSLQKIKDFINLKNKHGIGEADLMPDVYNFHAPGLSGSVMIDPATGNSICINNKDIRANYSSTSSGSINSWRITNVDGTQYYFNKAEETTTTFDSGGNEGTRKYNSAWYLTQITSPNRKDVYKFNYSVGTYWDQPQLYHNRQIAQNILSPCKTDIGPPDNTLIITSNLTDFRIKQSYLQEITHNDIRIIQINHTDERLDLKGRKRLGSIDIRSGAKRLKTFTLNHSYFRASTNATKEETYRLRLDSIHISGHYHTNATPVLSAEEDVQKYAFDYFGNGELPSRNSFSIDHLGYYNGANNQSLIPSYRNEKTGDFFTGANREPNIDFKIKGMLQEIHYPTGGSTTFEFDREALPPIAVIETGYESLNQIGSGSDPNADQDDYDCDDGFWHFPKTSTASFTVDEEEIYNPNITGYFFDASYANTPGSNNLNQEGRVFFMAIYRDRDVDVSQNYTVLSNGCIEINLQNADPLVLCPDECKPVTPEFPEFTICYNNYVQTNTDKTFCEINEMITNGDDDIMYYTFGAPTNSHAKISFPHEYLPVYYGLPSGNYKVFMANSLNGISFRFSRRYVGPVFQNQFKSDLKIKKIIDKTDQGVAYTRRFDYLEESQKQYIKLQKTTKTRDNTTPYCYQYGGDGTFKTLERYTSNLYTSAPYEVTYPKVVETREDVDGKTLGSTTYEFYDQPFYIVNGPFGTANSYNPKIGIPYIQTNPLNGQLKQTIHRDQSERILQSSTSTYDFDRTEVTSGIKLYGGTTVLEACTVVRAGEIDPSLNTLAYVDTTSRPIDGDPAAKTCSNKNGMTVIGSWSNITEKSDTPLQYFSFATQLKEKESKQFFYKGTTVDSVVQKSTYRYGTNHYMPIEVTTTTSQGNTTIAQTKYPEDLDNPSLAEQGLIDQNRINIPILVTNTVKDRDTTKSYISRQKTIFNNTTWSGYILPQTVQSAKGNTVLEDRMYYQQYEEGNPVTVSRKDGSQITYIWGYNHQYPIAKIQNASYSDISVYVSNLQTLSDADNDQTLDYSGTEGTLRKELDALRNTLKTVLPGAMVTTYTYDPLVGITSMTDPRGYTMYYEYDAFTRLMHVKDASGNILNKYYYNHAGESISQMQVSINVSKDWEYTNRTLNFEATVDGGSDQLDYRWEVTSTNNQNSTYTTKDINIPTGSSEGNLSVKLTVRDLVTGVVKTIEKTITIYQSMIASINTSKDWVYINSTMSITATANQGSGNYSYTWEVAKPLNQNTQHNGQQFDFQSGNVAGTATITLTVKDNVTGQSITKTKNIDIYQTQQARIDNVPQWMFVSTSKTLNAVVSRGSGNYDYTWKVTKPDNQISTYTSKDINFPSGTTAGVASIELTVSDNVTGQTVAVTKTIEIYDRIAFGNITAPSEVNLNSDVNFDVNPFKGSGQYTYDWELRARTTYRSSQKSFTLNMGCSYFGTVHIKCTIKDKVTGESKTLNAQTSVKLLALTNGSITSTPPVSSPPRTQKFQVQAKVNNGSGDYSYKWYVNGVVKGYSSTLDVTLKCSNPKTATVKCEITDNCIDQTFSATRDFTISSARCNDDGPGGGPGGGDDSDDSDNSNQ